MSFRIRRKHEELQSAMRDVGAAMKGWPDVDLARLLHVRVKFSRVLSTYLAEERAFLKKLPETRLRIEAVDDLQDLMVSYSAHVAAWTPDAIRSDWTGYVDALKVLDRRLLRRLAWEDGELSSGIVRAASS